MNHVLKVGEITFLREIPPGKFKFPPKIVEPEKGLEINKVLIPKESPSKVPPTGETPPSALVGPKGGKLIFKPGIISGTPLKGNYPQM